MRAKPAKPLDDDKDCAPWWRFPMVWLVIGGPAVVVLASFATLTLALLNPDPVISLPSASSKTEMPAVQGRNHAATPPGPSASP